MILPHVENKKTVTWIFGVFHVAVQLFLVRCIKAIRVTICEG